MQAKNPLINSLVRECVVWLSLLRSFINLADKERIKPSRSTTTASDQSIVNMNRDIFIQAMMHSSSGTLLIIIVIVLLIPLLTMTVLHKKKHPRRCDRCQTLFTETALQKHLQEDDCILTISGQQRAERRIQKHTVDRNYEPVMYYGAMPLPESSHSKAKQPPLSFEEEASYRHHGYSTDLRQHVEEAFRKRDAKLETRRKQDAELETRRKQDAELETRRKQDAELETRRECRRKIQEDVAPRTGQSAGLVQELSVGDRAEESLEGQGNSIVSVDVLNEQLRGIPFFDDDGVYCSAEE